MERKLVRGYSSIRISRKERVSRRRETPRKKQGTLEHVRRKWTQFGLALVTSLDRMEQLMLDTQRSIMEAMLDCPLLFPMVGWVYSVTWVLGWAIRWEVHGNTLALIL